MKKYILLLMLSPLAVIAQEKSTVVLPTDIYHEYRATGIPLIDGHRTSIRMTCTGFEVPKADRVQIRFTGSALDSSAKPLVIVDGREINHYFLKYISPSLIEKIDVLKSESAIEKYGEK